MIVYGIPRYGVSTILVRGVFYGPGNLLGKGFGVLGQDCKGFPFCSQNFKTFGLTGFFPIYWENLRVFSPPGFFSPGENKTGRHSFGLGALFWGFLPPWTGGRKLGAVWALFPGLNQPFPRGPPPRFFVVFTTEGGLLKRGVVPPGRGKPCGVPLKKMGGDFCFPHRGGERIPLNPLGGGAKFHAAVGGLGRQQRSTSLWGGGPPPPCG